MLPVLLRVTLFLVSGLMSGRDPSYNAGRPFSLRWYMQLFLSFCEDNTKITTIVSRVRHE